MSSATKAVVYFDEEVFAHKKMIPMSPEFVKECFGNVTVLNSASELSDLVNVAYDKGDNILLMSSGKFNNADFKFI